jgi:putative membrane protein
MFRSIPHQRYLALLGAIFAAVFTVSAIRPHHLTDWLLENALVIPALLLIYAWRRRLKFSRISYTLIFVFLCLHELGAHYTYAEVPYQKWFPALAGGRNHFDRLVHFCYGLLIAYPVREIFLRVADVRGFWGYFLPLDLTMSTSMLFELIEWLAVGVFGGDLGVAYLGTQGDPWDAHKDMALASLGALFAMLITAAINVRLQRDFAREWNESLRVKHRAPLGEDAIARMQRQQER